MIILVGLGNPGKEYQNTRHNAGFGFLDRLAREERVDFAYNKYFNAEFSRLTLESQDIILLKPQTFMNLSGQSVQGLMSYFHIPTDKVWIVYDDVDLDLGVIRVREEGSAGGHKGLKSVIESLGTQKIPRFRIGVKNEQFDKIPTDKFVLQKFSVDEQRAMDVVYGKTKELLIEALKSGIKETSASV